MSRIGMTFASRSVGAFAHQAFLPAPSAALSHPRPPSFQSSPRWSRSRSRCRSSLSSPIIRASSFSPCRRERVHASRSSRLFSASSRTESESESPASSPSALPNLTGDRHGLLRHEILADDGHPLRLYSRAPSSHSSSPARPHPLLTPQTRPRSILLIHGRTWSSQPVYDLRTSPDDEKRQSTLQTLTDLGFCAYAIDLRGFGETPRDRGGEGYTTPSRCVEDVRCAIDWITRRHAPNNCNDENNDNNNNHNNHRFAQDDTIQDPTIINTKPSLLGWSQGALIAQLYAQKYGTSTLSDLILFGSIYDPRTIYPRRPLYDPHGNLVSDSHLRRSPSPRIPNTDVSALEDFTLPGSICDEAALSFSRLALATDPYKAPWENLHEFNAANPALVRVPTMVIAGDQDPYVGWEAQRELFERLGTEDRVWCILPGCDHAAHILKGRRMFVRSLVGFLLRKDELF